MPDSPRLPRQLTGPRMTLRMPEPGDAAAINAATAASFAELTQWMDWATEPISMEATEAFIQHADEVWQANQEWPLLMIDGDGNVVGASGFAYIDWQVPSFEIGYWVRTSEVGRGYASEATRMLSDFAFSHLNAARVYLRMDDRNQRSYAVAERLGFQLEGIMRSDCRDNSGGLRNTRVYAKIREQSRGG